MVKFFTVYFEKFTTKIFENINSMLSGQGIMSEDVQVLNNFRKNSNEKRKDLGLRPYQFEPFKQDFVAP